ncbi:MAG: YidC/Oxa1 family membrane protein insertase [Patescibacteria group bacterium]|nr:YidC/Oxa1 family membrane protein insertase [Patescibacteria group bacterium]
MLGQIFNTVLYQPIYNLLIFFYNIVPGHDIGVAIILLTIVIKLILYPLSLKSIKAQKAMKELQPKIQELQKKYKDKKEELARKTMELYKQEKVSPMSGCLPLLLQLPFLIAVYQVFRAGLNSADFSLLYPFVQNPGTIETRMFGLEFLNLANPIWLFAVVAGLAQFWQTKMLSTQQPPVGIADKTGAKDENVAAIMNKQMQYMMPAVTVIIGLSLPGGLTLYWMLSTLLMVAQQYYSFNKKEKSVIIKDEGNTHN